ncbi:MFS transporter [Jeotgalibacillus haloalkalitolerans]|uniref:MFS transporter n=1 Tax=Jeotgalibacillus haloalkalitolerans TaxID=3104292 RepID=A0ABU5KHL9_9BACL|nr:MFS transporter [Jeotgalibacillus sp. HH7-29]MDZ5710722.1 MFS transporter [Jeotgalibacillus sp. HH7-29]
MIKNKNIWILLVGEFIAGFGLWLGIIGDLAFMQDKIPSDFHKSLILATGILAGIALGPLAGKAVDQMKKKTIMLYAGVGRLISTGFMLIAIETGSIVWMIAFLISINIAAAFYFPALQAAIPLVTEESELVKVNGLHMNISTLSRIAGTAAAGIFLSLMSLTMLYIIAGIAYTVLLLLTMQLKIDEKQEEAGRVVHEEKQSRGFMKVFPVIREHPAVIPTMLLTLAPLLFIGGFNLIIINVSEILEDPAVKGWLYTIEGVAFILGTLFVRRFDHSMPAKSLFAFAMLIGLSQLMLIYVTYAPVALLAFALFGFAVGSFFPLATTMFQTTIPSPYHGRFFSFRGMLDDFIYQFILIVTGLLLDTLALQQMMFGYGLLSLVLAFGYLMRVRGLRVIQGDGG